jgi:hypothetical protein
MSRLPDRLVFEGEVLPPQSLQLEKQKCFTIIQAILDTSQQVNRARNRARRLNEKVDALWLDFGRSLLIMRRRVEAGEAGDVTWWHWFTDNIQGPSRKTAERWLGIAAEEDPEAATLEYRKHDAERHRLSYQRQKQLALPSENYCPRETEPDGATSTGLPACAHRFAGRSFGPLPRARTAPSFRRYPVREDVSLKSAGAHFLAK